METRISSTEYTCQACGQTFYFGWADELAQAEAVANFGRRGDTPGMVIVCDDCYRAMLADWRWITSTQTT
jgi:hypothetical protein